MHKKTYPDDLLMKLEELTAIVAHSNCQGNNSDETILEDESSGGRKKNNNSPIKEIESLKEIENNLIKNMTLDNQKKFSLSTATLKVSERVREKLIYLKPLLRFEENTEDTTFNNIIDILIH